MASGHETLSAELHVDIATARTDVLARDRVVRAYLPLVRKLCARFGHSAIPQEDLVQIAVIGLLKAIGKFQLDRGSSFLAFAVPVMIGEIKNYFRDHGWSVKIPRKLQRQKRDVERAVEGLTQKMGRSPTVQEIAQATGFLEEEIYDTFEVGTYGRLLSLDAVYEGDGANGPSTLGDRVGAADAELDGLVDRMDLADKVSCLEPRERAIIHLKFYADMSQAEIASKLGISQMHVSRLQRRALEKLKLNLVG